MTRQRVNPLLVRRPAGGRSRLEQDKELFNFINSLDRYYSLEAMRELIIKKFGKERAPSTSALHRYIQKITKENP